MTTEKTFDYNLVFDQLNDLCTDIVFTLNCQNDLSRLSCHESKGYLLFQLFDSLNKQMTLIQENFTEDLKDQLQNTTYSEFRDNYLNSKKLVPFEKTA